MDDLLSSERHANLIRNLFRAAAETYMGQVETGVGLIPAGAGTKELERVTRAPGVYFVPRPDGLVVGDLTTVRRWSSDRRRRSPWA